MLHYTNTMMDENTLLLTHLYNEYDGIMHGTVDYTLLHLDEP